MLGGDRCHRKAEAGRGHGVRVEMVIFEQKSEKGDRKNLGGWGTSAPAREWQMRGSGMFQSVQIFSQKIASMSFWFITKLSRYRDIV